MSEVEFDPAVQTRARSSGHDVVVLPVREQDDGVAVYPEASVSMVKELKAIGVDASFLDPADHRVFEVKKGALETAIISLVLGIASSAGWDGIKRLLRQRSNSRLSVKYVELEDRNQYGRAWQVSGDDTDAVLAAIDKLRQPGLGNEHERLPDT
ncbi:MAG TPA: hypothetical protein VNQ77_15020 [Frankiaceae bacterium]|nr:hypothetical protein [Frankiaceae bacterium]